MVQILQPQPKKPGFTESILGGIGDNIQPAIEKYMQHQQQQKQMAQENATIKQLTGQDLSGVTNPEQRKAYVTELLKQGGKQQRLGQTQDFLSNVFGNRQQQNQEIPQNQIMNEQQFDPSNLSDSDIAQASALDPNLGRILQQQKDSGMRQKSEQQKMGFEREKLERHEAADITKPIFLELNASRKNIPLQEQAIEDIQNAASEVSGQDYIADVFGFEPMRTAKGAQLKTAIKDFFLSDLTRVGARPNQWIEQQLADALPKIGRSPEANLITAEGMKFKVDLAKKRIEILDDLAESDEKKYTFVKKDWDSRASKLMKPYVEQRKKELEENIKSIKDTYKANEKPSKGYVRMINPDTNEIFDILKGHVKDAQKAGWTKQ